MAMKKLDLAPLQPQAARGFRYLQVPRLLIEDENYAPLDDGAKFLYSLMLERSGLSAQNADKFMDANGRFFIIYTVEQMKQKMNRSRPTIIKWTKQLEEIGLIKKVRLGQGKPSKIYINDFASMDCPQEVKKVDSKKSKNLTSKSQKALPLEVKSFYPIELENIDLEKKDLPSLREDVEDVEEVTANVHDQVEYPILRQEYGASLADEVVSLITEVLCRSGPAVRIGQDSYPAGFAKERMRSVGYEHAAYALDTLGRAGPVRNAHNYLLALLFNAPAGYNAAVKAQYSADFAN
ncbi:replication initiator protein A [Oscillospiraceae bacterium 21-37]